MFDEIHEECGVFGAYQLNQAADLTYYGLHSLQHRGQEASGIALWDGSDMKVHKGKGLTVDVFTKEDLKKLQGRNAIGHVRYSTAGGQEKENIQPIAARGRAKKVAFVHNGQIVNEKELRIALEEKGAIFQGTSDSEVILHLIQMSQGTMLERVKKAASLLEGAFSFIVMDGENMYAARDRHGLRPLSVAKKEDGYLISSETCAFEIMNIHDFWDVKPGEVIEFSKGLVKHHMYSENVDHHMCAMEYIYFARPDSDIESLNVHLFRKETGKILAQADMADPNFHADIVIGVPDSSLSAAIGYAEQSGIDYETGLVKNRFVQRTFIQPTQQLRENSVKMKLSAISEVVSGKSVVMIDDSIVRGTTSKRIVKLLKEAGAAKVHVRIASPVISSPCFYGVDTSTKEELIGARMSVEEINAYIGSDSLHFMSSQELEKAAGKVGLCMACFTGNYPTELFSYQSVLNQE
jgi:amidophosphoribosyltransferase